VGRSLRSLLFLILSGSSIEGHAEDLLELYRHALETNPVLKGREYDVDRTSAQKNQAQSKLLPQLSAVGNRSWNDFDTRGIGAEQYYGKRGTIQGRQALFDLPSYRSLEAAEARNLQSKEELQAARMDIAGELVDRYLEVLGASDEITHLQAEREAAESQLGRLRRMYERQLAKVTDLYEVEAYYQTLNAREIETQNAKAVALEKLRETAGVVVQEVAPLVRESFPAVPGVADEWVQDAARNNRNLIALQHAIDSEPKDHCARPSGTSAAACRGGV
jgi:outer membrane protein